MQNFAREDWAFVIAAYSAAWIAVGGYWLFVHRAVKRARARHERSDSAGRIVR